MSPAECRLTDVSIAHRLVVDLWVAEAWRRAPLARVGERWAGGCGDARVELQLDPAGDHWRWRLHLESPEPTRVRLALELPEAEDPYPILPGVLFGDNNLAVAPGPMFPHLARHRHQDNYAPYWEFRADRCSHPAALLAGRGVAAGVGIDPYCDDATGAIACTAADADDRGETRREPCDWVRNGVFARLADGDRPDACGVTLGYRNDPLTYVCKGRFDPPASHRLCTGTASGTIALQPAADRRGLHAIVESLYAAIRTPPTPAIDRETGIHRISTAMTTVGWDPAAENWFDGKWDFARGAMRSLRGANHEIAWTGGTQSAFPLLVYACEYDDATALAQATTVLDRIAAEDSYNPASGWLYDSRDQEHRRPGAYGWWYRTTPTAHYAYTNGQALFYLLAAYHFGRGRALDGRQRWRDMALRVLDQALAVQTAEGNFGYAYSGETGRIVDPFGFAGCWFVPALVLAWVATREERYLVAARRGLAFYRGYVDRLWCWGTPMDTRKAVDQEGVLAFIRGARLLHQLAGDADALDALDAGARYEYLFRFAFRTRPEAEPLASADWNACGGSLTSTSNPHIHPMGLLVSGDLAYLAEQTGSSYHRQRLQDGLLWALGSIELYPDRIGYGSPGVLTERFCPSDGLLIERYPDGSPASVWWSNHVWGAANVLEGLLDCDDAVLDALP